MDLYALNFKRVLVVLTTKDMRINILNLFDNENVDVNVKFSDSYSHAVKLINDFPHDPFDHIILNLSANNQKLKDFVEFIQPTTETKPDYLIEYTKEAQLHLVSLIREDD